MLRVKRDNMKKGIDGFRGETVRKLNLLSRNFTGVSRKSFISKLLFLSIAHAGETDNDTT